MRADLERPIACVAAATEGKPGLSPEATAPLLAHDRPGSLREIVNPRALAATMWDGIAVLPAHLPDAPSAGTVPADGPPRVLDALGGNVSAAARDRSTP